MSKKFGIDFSQPSTRKGLALIGAGIAVAMGHPELLAVDFASDGVQVGGVIGLAVTGALGLWETLRNEIKK